MTEESTPIESFRIDIDQSELDDLQQRLAMVRWPEKEPVDDWSQGVPLGYLAQVCDYWQHQYDWRRCEAQLNSLAQFRTRLDGLQVHFIHARSPRGDARPLILTHGWPGSVVEFLKVIGPLSDPEAHNAPDAPAFDVICPSLPGYGFSERPAERGWTVERIADAWVELMSRLGYSKFLAQGGDWGAAVTTAIAERHPERCLGIHLNLPTVRPDKSTFDNLREDEKAALEALQFYREWDSGYSMQQSTRPQTLGYALVDSPVGQAAWILEKFYAWTDCDGHPENVLSRDEMLDNIMLYWLPRTAASSARLYFESFGKIVSDGPIEVPVGLSQFPREIFKTSKRWAEQRYKKLVYWATPEKGGHFAAFEQPQAFVDELRACFFTDGLSRQSSVALPTGALSMCHSNKLEYQW